MQVIRSDGSARRSCFWSFIIIANFIVCQTLVFAQTSSKQPSKSAQSTEVENSGSPEANATANAGFEVTNTLVGHGSCFEHCLQPGRTLSGLGWMGQEAGALGRGQRARIAHTCGP